VSAKQLPGAYHYSGGVLRCAPPPPTKPPPMWTLVAPYKSPCRGAKLCCPGLDRAERDLRRLYVRREQVRKSLHAWRCPHCEWYHPGRNGAA
jgi:hypothetical protein